ncbi:ImmA/IrrE family metallo-endopeptidase [Streptomyces sp. ODS28]|uniref:ImmA/IrrE family metallo-endopeptidase n=1 Tax=Streptomyces sp. ODS28 TaxID=3136688 RepID=UPI0031EABE04
MNWTVAHRIAGIRAIQAHCDLGIDRTRYISVHRALGAAGIVGMAQPMPRLFGVYYAPPDNGPAVLLNASLNVITQRHTAAHELGHHLFGHRTAADEDLDPALRRAGAQWPEEEKLAEAFAAWFLMPRPAVQAGLARICRGAPSSPEEVYRLAQELGTSYAGTVRHLDHLRMLAPGQAGSWAKIAPAALRKSLSGGGKLPSDRQLHVLTAASHQQQVHAEAGDVLLAQAPAASFAALPAGLSAREGALPAGPAVTVTEELSGPVRLEMTMPDRAAPVEITVVRESPRHGIDEVWPD